MKKTATASTPRSETCRICDRPFWGEGQELGFGKWRHSECAPGSQSWVEYYLRGPRTEAGDFLLAHCYQRAAERKERREAGVKIVS